MAREVVSFDEIITQDYNNDVEGVTKRIADAIDIQGTQEPNIGTELGNKICTKLQEENGTDVCGLNAPSVLNKIINSLPVYFIIAHSTVDIHLRDTAQRDGVELDPGQPVFSKIEGGNDLSQSQFLVNTTTVGGWGLLNEDYTCIPRGHLLKVTPINIRSHLFSPGINCEKRIDMFVAEEGEYGRKNEILSTSYPPMFNITGTKYINKIHQFGGDKLSGGGFGIIKLTGDNHGTAYNLLEKWSESKGSDETNFDDNVYFLTDLGMNEQDIKLHEELRKRWKRKGPFYDGSFMWNSEMSTSDILKYGGPGIYISLSCSVYTIQGLGRGPELANANSPDHVLLGEITNVLRSLSANNRNEWDKFVELLRFNPSISTRTTQEQPNVSTLARVRLAGPKGTDIALEMKDSIASRVKREGGKRKTRKRRKQKTRKKSRGKARRKTKQKKKRRRRRKTKRKRRKTNKK